jgi:hypothetical protein
MNVGNAIKTNGPPAIAMIKYAMEYWDKCKVCGNIPSSSAYYDADKKYKGYLKYAEMFSKLWSIINSKRVAMMKDSDDHLWIKTAFFPWFKDWQEESRQRGIEDLRIKNIDQDEQELSNYFFTTAAAKDLINMVTGIVSIVDHYGELYASTKFLLGVISSDVNEHSFGDVRERVGDDKADDFAVSKASSDIAVTKAVGGTMQLNALTGQPRNKRNSVAMTNTNYSPATSLDLKVLKNYREGMKLKVTTLRNSMSWDDEKNCFISVPNVNL